MPSYDLYKKTLGSPSTLGEFRKKQSDMIMEATWDGDIQSKVAYFYDYYHDDEPLKYYDIHPEKSKTKIPVDIKYIINAYNSENKDVVGKHIQFKPSFRWDENRNLSYYNDYVERYESNFPIGLYCDIKDESGKYRKWMVTELANSYDLQFPTWYILPVDHVFQWIYNDKLYQMCGIGRSQNS